LPAPPFPRLLAAAVIVALILLLGSRTSTEGLPAPVIRCALDFTSPQLIPVSGRFDAILIDSGCEHLYLANFTQNRIDDLSLRTFTFTSPIVVGPNPVSMDFRPGTSLMYVANFSAATISLVDLTSRLEVRQIPVPPDGKFAQGAFSIAFPSSGIALYSARNFCCTGGKLMQLDLATEISTIRTDYIPTGFGWAAHPTRLRASRDRTVVAIADGTGQVVKYAAATNSFGGPRSLQLSFYGIAVNGTGSTVFVAPGAFVLDSALNLSGTVTHTSFWSQMFDDDPGGVEISLDGREGYRTLGSNLEVIDLVTFLKTRDIALGDTTSTRYTTAWGSVISSAGQMDLSDDGRLLAVTTDHGIVLVPTGAIPFTDDPLLPGTTMKGVHISELRGRIDAVRSRLGLSPYAWTDALLAGVTARAVHLSEMRTAVQQAYSGAGLTPPAFSESLTAGATVIKSAQITELRSALLRLEIN
jgi:hypothetical protein